MKRTIEIDDTLQETVEGVQEDLKNLLIEYLNDNKEEWGPVDGNNEDFPCLSNDLDYSGGFHEIVDGSVPVYTHEIESLWYLYKSDFEQAYEDAGVGDNPLDNNGMAAIHYYLEQKASEWYQ